MPTKKKAEPALVPYDDSKWRAEDDMRTLARAQEIMADKKRLAAAKACAKEKLAEMQAVTNLATSK